MCGSVNSLIGLKKNLEINDFHHTGKAGRVELPPCCNKWGENPNWLGMKRPEIYDIAHS